MSTQNTVNMRLIEKGATEITPILGQMWPEHINNPKDEVSRVMDRGNIALYKMGKKICFLVIILGKNCYQVKIGDDTWEFVNTYNWVLYKETVVNPVSITITRAQSSRL